MAASPVTIWLLVGAAAVVALQLALVGALVARGAWAAIRVRRLRARSRIVRDLLDRNCDLLDTDEELYDFVDDPALFFEARGDADASTLARPATLDPNVLATRQARVRQETAQRCQALAAR